MENKNNAHGSNEKLLAALAYVGILILIPFFVAKDKPFVKYHLKQGAVLIVIEIIMWVLRLAFWPLWPILGLIRLTVLILAIIGIVNVVKHREKELPLVGQFAKHFKF